VETRPSHDGQGTPLARELTEDLTDAQLARYARHVILDEIGESGQARLLSARVLGVGADGIGAAALMYLAGAGVGVIGILDHGQIDAGSLHRQVFHDPDDTGRARVDALGARIEALNPDVTVARHRQRLTEAGAAALFGDYDLVLDSSDGFAARSLVNRVCFRLGVPFISAAVSRFEGQIAAFRPAGGGPCYQCLFASPPDPDLVPRCDTVGVLGPVAGLLGCLQATEAVKMLLGLGQGLAGDLLLYNALEQRLDRIAIRKTPGCPVCGTA